MRTPYGAWRASYVHGRWTVLSGPTSMVIVEPSPDTTTDFIGGLWATLLDCASISQIVRILADRGLDAMPNLAVLFWDDEQLHCLLRGSVRVLDADNDTELASGAGALTWHELTLSSRSVYLPLDGAARSGESLELPLVVGAVQAAEVYLDAEPGAGAARDSGAAAEAAALWGDVGFSAAEPEPAVPWDAIGAPAAEPAPSAAAEPAAGIVENSVNLYDSPFGERLIVPPVFPDAEPEPSAPVAPAASEQPWTRGPVIPGPIAREAADEGSRDDAQQYSEPVFTEPPIPAFEPSAPVFEPASPAFETVAEPAVDAWPVQAPESQAPAARPVFAREPTQVLGQRPPYAPGQEPDAEPGQSAGALGQPTGAAGQSLGPAGTTGPWGAAGFAARESRPAGAPAPTQAATPMPQQAAAPMPPAVLLTAAGERIVLTGPVVIGRSPSAESGEQVLRVPSPNHDISRTHLRIAPTGGRIQVSDLNSTNGTIVIFPNGQTAHLTNGRSIELMVGGAVDLGDGQTISVLAP